MNFQEREFYLIETSLGSSLIFVEKITDHRLVATEFDLNDLSLDGEECLYFIHRLNNGLYRNKKIEPEQLDGVLETYLRKQRKNIRKEFEEFKARAGAYL